MRIEAENAKLRSEVERLRQHLISLQILHGGLLLKMSVDYFNSRFSERLATTVLDSCSLFVVDQIPVPLALQSATASEPPAAAASSGATAAVNGSSSTEAPAAEAAKKGPAKDKKEKKPADKKEKPAADKPKAAAASADGNSNANRDTHFLLCEFISDYFASIRVYSLLVSLSFDIIEIEIIKSF